MRTCPNCKSEVPTARWCPLCASAITPLPEAGGEARVSFVLSDWLDDMRRRVERAEDQIINATNAKEKDHAIIRYETVRDILSAFERKAEMSSNK